MLDSDFTLTFPSDPRVESHLIHWKGKAIALAITPRIAQLIKQALELDEAQAAAELAQQNLSKN